MRYTIDVIHYNNHITYIIIKLYNGGTEMIVYHGSNSCFKNLRIHKSLVKSSATALNEGLGIYFSTDIEVARSYGKYMYTIEIQDEYFKDFRLKAVCRDYIKEIIKYIYKEEKINIAYLIDVKTLINYMYYGGVGIYNVGREVHMLLDSNEEWHIGISESKKDRIYKLLKNYGKNNLHAYMFNYNIKNIGIIKDVNIATILSREATY